MIRKLLSPDCITCQSLCCKQLVYSTTTINDDLKRISLTLRILSNLFLGNSHENFICLRVRTCFSCLQAEITTLLVNKKKQAGAKTSATYID